MEEHSHDNELNNTEPQQQEATAANVVAGVDSAQNMPAPTPPVEEKIAWCVLRVASNKEISVRDALLRKVKIEGLEDTVRQILVPTETRPGARTKTGKKKVVQRKLYPGYVFLEMKLQDDGAIEESAWFTIKETTGVGDFIGAAGKPTPMAPDDVAKMLAQVVKAQEGSQVSVEFEAGESVKVKEGPFENFEGIIDEVIPDKGLIRVTVTIFGRATPVELEYWQVEKI